MELSVSIRQSWDMAQDIIYRSWGGNEASWLCLMTFVVQWLSHVQLFAAPWTAAHQASLSFAISQSLLRLMSTESVVPSNPLIPCHPLLFLLFCLVFFPLLLHFLTSLIKLTLCLKCFYRRKAGGGHGGGCGRWVRHRSLILLTSITCLWPPPLLSPQFRLGFSIQLLLECFSQYQQPSFSHCFCCCLMWYMFFFFFLSPNLLINHLWPNIFFFVWVEGCHSWISGLPDNCFSAMLPLFFIYC